MGIEVVLFHSRKIVPHIIDGARAKENHFPVVVSVPSQSKKHALISNSKICDRLGVTVARSRGRMDDDIDPVPAHIVSNGLFV